MACSGGLNKRMRNKMEDTSSSNNFVFLSNFLI